MKSPHRFTQQERSEVFQLANELAKTDRWTLDGKLVHSVGGRLEPFASVVFVDHTRLEYSWPALALRCLNEVNRQSALTD